MPVAVLLGRVDVHFVLHGHPRGGVQPTPASVVDSCVRIVSCVVLDLLRGRSLLMLILLKPGLVIVLLNHSWKNKL